MQQRDLQRLHHLADCQQLLYSIAELFHLELPPRASCSPKHSQTTPSFLWESFGSPSASVEALCFDDWLQTVDLRNVSAVHIIGKAITKSPGTVSSAWSSCKHEASFSLQLKALVLVLTGHALSIAQVSIRFATLTSVGPFPQPR